jgi:ketosteroid isomerase-like protein
MPARSPEDLQDLYAGYFNAGDVEGIVTLYEPHALRAGQAGLVVGVDAIREVLSSALRMRERTGQLWHIKSVRVFSTGGLALSRTVWRVERRDRDGNKVEHELVTVEVCRQQDDGTWKYVIDAPFLLAES